MPISLLAHGAGGVCLVGLGIAWWLAPPSTRHRFISEILAGRDSAALTLKIAFTIAACAFAIASAARARNDAVLGPLGLATAAALLATTWIKMPMPDVVSSRRTTWWHHPVAAQLFFGLAAGYQIANLSRVATRVETIAVGEHLAMTAWLTMTVIYAASANGLPTPPRVCAALIDTRADSRAAAIRASEWPATLALALAFTMGP